MDLKNTYIGVPVVRSLRLINLSNLPAQFEFDEPARHGKNADTVARTWHTTFEPNSGVLSSKESLQVKFTFTARRPGRVEALFACDIEGMQRPLGFTLQSISKGLVVTYERVDEKVPLSDIDDESNEPKVSSVMSLLRVSVLNVDCR